MFKFKKVLSAVVSAVLGFGILIGGGSMSVGFKGMGTVLAEASINRELPQVPDKGAQPSASQFVLVYGTEKADLFISENDFEGAEIALNSFSEDVELVSGVKPEVKNSMSTLGKMAVMVGTIGKDSAFDAMLSTKGIDVSAINGKWESYIIRVVNNPVAGVDRAIVVVGSDKRGTIYGIYRLSEEIGVSPWVFWGDSYPVRSGKITFESNFSVTQGEPSVKYRGIFLNDEAPSLSTYVNKKYGNLVTMTHSSANKGYNNIFYQTVFELILRLKGNYLWPAMWNNSFNTDDPLNPIMADKYGVVMGTSHQEHLTCADKEWSWTGKGAWNYGDETVENGNRQNVYDFWDRGVGERKDFETVLTMGMRGQQDTAILGPDATIEDNIQLLQDVIDDQREIIERHYGSKDGAPQVLSLYKEVENFYYGTENLSLNVPDDVTLMICDDNFGNVRALPSEGMRARSGGYGMYYHFDYRGGPISYQWINQTPLAKIYEQMSTAYYAGVQQIWIVNVGDLKPMELPIDYFLNLAYDFDKWGDINKTDEFTRQFAAREFGQENAVDTAEALNIYTDLVGTRKAEIVLSDPSTFSLTSFDEAERILEQCNLAIEKAENVYSKIPDYKKDAYFQLVLYPVRSAMNVYRVQIYTAFSKLYAKNNLTVANEYAKLASDAFKIEQADMVYYNKEMSEGKWDGMMSQNHYSYSSWDSPSNSIVADKLPVAGSVTPSLGSEMVVRAQNSESFVKSGSVDLPEINNKEQAVRYFDILNGKKAAFNYVASANKPWVVITKDKGTVINQLRVSVSVDFSKLTGDDTAVITVEGAGSSITVNVTARVISTTLDDKTFIETDGYVSINPKNYSNNVAQGGAKFEVLEGYGRDTDTVVKVLPNDRYFEVNADSPYLEYKFLIQNAGTYNVNVFIAPSNSAVHKSVIPLLEQLRMTTKIDSTTAVTKSGIPTADFEPGEYKPGWEYGVTNNTRMVAFNNGAALGAGVHTLKLSAVDPNVVIQRIIISNSSSSIQVDKGRPQTYHFLNSYYGPYQSYFVGVGGDANKNHVSITSGIRQFGAEDVEVKFTLSNGTVVSTLNASAENGSKLTREQIDSVESPEKFGSVFRGWEMPDGGGYVDENTVFVEPTAVVAAFIEEDKAITITLNPNGGNGSEIKRVFESGDIMTVEGSTFTLKDRVFVCWNTKADGSGDSISAGASVKVTENKTLYAFWAKSVPKVLASSELSANRSQNAFDGKDNTAWKPLKTNNEWIDFSFDGEKTVESVNVKEAAGVVTAWRLEYLDKNSGEFVLAMEGTTLGADKTITLNSAVTTTTMRLKIVSASAAFEISEISVFDSSGKIAVDNSVPTFNTTDPAPKKGCKGNVLTQSIIIWLTILTSLAVCMRKRKQQ